MRDFLSEEFLIECLPGLLVAGWGPLQSSGQRLDGRLAFFAPDFFLEDATPWKHPAQWEEVTRTELAERLRRHPPNAPEVDWVAPEREDYLEHFESVMRRILEGVLSKAVPIVLEQRHTTVSREKLVRWLLSRALDTHTTAYVYGGWEKHGGLLGASPKLLFRAIDGRKIETVVIAGTYPLDRAEHLAEDPKAQDDEVLRNYRKSTGRVHR